jgi:hypothetical protein
MSKKELTSKKRGIFKKAKAGLSPKTEGDKKAWKEDITKANNTITAPWIIQTWNFQEHRNALSITLVTPCNLDTTTLSETSMPMK